MESEKKKKVSNSEKEIRFVGVMLYTLNPGRVVGQLCLSKTERKKKKDDIEIKKKKKKAP